MSTSYTLADGQTWQAFDEQGVSKCPICDRQVLADIGWHWHDGRRFGLSWRRWVYETPYGTVLTLRAVKLGPWVGYRRTVWPRPMV